MTEAQKNAIKRYREKNLRRMTLQFYGDKEKELFEKAKQLGNAKIKDLISRA